MIPLSPFILFLLLLGGLTLITRTLTTLLHELGHAIPALLLTRKKVMVYIGSYGDPEKSMRITIGKLELYFKYNPFLWHGGVCMVAHEDISINRQILYTLTGPLASFIIAATASYFTFAYDLHAFLKLFLIVFLGSSLYDLYWNLIPQSSPANELYDGSMVYNDGYQLKQLFLYRKLNRYLLEAAALYDQGRFKEAVPLFDKVLQAGVDDEEVYRVAFHNYIYAKEFEKAEAVCGKLHELGTMNFNDQFNRGYLFLELGVPDKALEIFNELLLQGPENAITLNNIGYSLSLLNRFEEAIPPLNKAIELNNDFAFAYNNRGLARIKTGQTEEGLQDIYHSMELDSTNAYTHKNLGIYHFDRAAYKEALQLFTKAKEMDNETYRIDEHIREAEERINGHQ